jgi:hypothetical protein
MTISFSKNKPLNHKESQQFYTGHKSHMKGKKSLTKAGNLLNLYVFNT